jgi:ubiquinone/menaquinone biosynthesis C-methylase UbiE
VPTLEFVLESLPPAPARVLEVGCGRGTLARALATSGYDVTAIDPEAPDGPIFRRMRLEELEHDATFDAVVMVVSLHHVEDVSAALDRVVSVLGERGLLVLEEFAKERLRGPAARWYWRQLQARAEVGRDQSVDDDFDRWLVTLQARLADIHQLAVIRRELETRFVERTAAWSPYLYRFELDEAIEALESKLIRSNAIDATGFRYVGERR